MEKWGVLIALLICVLIGVLLVQNRREVALILCQRQTLAAYEGLLERQRAQEDFHRSEGRYATSMSELKQSSESGRYRYALENVSASGFLLRAESQDDTQTMDENGILDHPRDGCAKAP